MNWEPYLANISLTEYQRDLRVKLQTTERQGENPCHVLLVLLGLMSAPHCTHVRAALVSIKESS